MQATDWDKLRIFHAVAEAGSLTEAGKSLNLSQSAVSRQISTLEESLGIALFRRHARGLVLSEQGEMLFETTRTVSAELTGIKGKLVDTHGRLVGPLTISAPELIGSTLIAPRLYHFKEQYPDIQLTVMFEERIFNLNTKKADIAIRLKKPTEIDHIQKRLATIDFHICASTEYLEKYGRPEKIEDLQNHCLISFPDQMQSPFLKSKWLYEIAKIDVNKHNNLVMMNSIYAIYRAVQKSSGIAVLPDYMINYADNIEIILPELERPSVDMYFVYAEERRNSQRIQAFRDFLIKNINDTDLLNHVA